MRTTNYTIVAALALVLAGCASDREHRDLHEFMAQARKQPGGEIEPLPTATPYKTVSYRALTLRSPFEEPVLLVAEREAAGKSTVKPNENRQRELLESVNFAALSMVGSLSRDGQIWSLLNDGQGGIHRVRIGNYIGKNHGRIVAISREKVDLIEIVPDGKGGWIERPRSLTLSD